MALRSHKPLDINLWPWAWLVPYNWYLKGGYFCDSGPHLDRPCSHFLLSWWSLWSRSPGFSVLHKCCALAFLYTLPATKRGTWAGAPEIHLLSPDVPWCLFGQWHVKANKIRSGQRCDKVSAPMAVPGLWQAPGQAFSMTPGWWLTKSISHQNSQSESRRKCQRQLWEAPQAFCHCEPQGTLSVGRPTQVGAAKGGCLSE